MPDSRGTRADRVCSFHTGFGEGEEGEALETGLGRSVQNLRQFGRNSHRRPRVPVQDAPVPKSRWKMFQNSLQVFFTARRWLAACLVTLAPLLITVVPRILIYLAGRFATKLLESAVEGASASAQQLAVEAERAADIMVSVVTRQLDVPDPVPVLNTTGYEASRSGIPGWLLLGALYIAHTLVQTVASYPMRSTS